MITLCEQRCQKIELDQDGYDPCGCKSEDPIEHVEVNQQKGPDNLPKRRQIFWEQVIHDDPFHKNRYVKKGQNPHSAVEVESDCILSVKAIFPLPVSMIDTVAGYDHEEPNGDSTRKRNEKKQVYPPYCHRCDRLRLKMVPYDG
jgi:hypothetical protein